MNLAGCRSAYHPGLAVAVEIRSTDAPNVLDLLIFPKQFALSVQDVQTGRAIVADDHFVRSVTIEIGGPNVVDAGLILPKLDSIGVGSDKIADPVRVKQETPGSIRVPPE